VGEGKGHNLLGKEPGLRHVRKNLAGEIEGCISRGPVWTPWEPTLHPKIYSCRVDNFYTAEPNSKQTMISH
jgi:hypothetical protein